MFFQNVKIHRLNLVFFCFNLVFCSGLRKDDWPDKRMAMDDRYGRSDFPRQERYQDFDHRDRSRYQDNMGMDRRDNSRGMGTDRDGQVGDVKFAFVPWLCLDCRRLIYYCLISCCSTSQTEARDMAETTGAEATTNA